MSVVITLPPPSAALHAHAKGRWQSKSGPTRKLRQLACTLAKEHVTGPPWQEAAITYQFWFADFRRRDSANAIQAMKAAVDGVVDAGLIQDDDWQRLRIDGVHCGVDKENPRTELVFERVEGIIETMRRRLDDERREAVDG